MSSFITDWRKSPKGGRLPPLNRLVTEELAETSEEETTGHDAVPIRSEKGVKNFTRVEHNNWRKESNSLTAIVPASTEIANLDTRAKPKFLNDLEKFLVKEISITNRPTDIKLQAYREVFEYLIEDFKQYKPLLASVKNEYEMMMKHQQDYIKLLEPLEQMLDTVAQQSERKIMQFRDDEKKEMLAVKKENERLQSVVDSIKNDRFALQIQVERLQQRLTEQYEKYRAEADNRKLLVSNINDLRAQQDELLIQQQQASSKDKSEDPVVIRQELKLARESEKQATQQLNDIIANYGDVLPKQEYLTLQTQHDSLAKKVAEKVTEFNKIKSEHDALLESHKQIIKLRDEFYQESERLRQNATPRPDWNKCANAITGGSSRWLEISQEKSSNELVTILLHELAGITSENSAPDYIDFLGTSESVPFHLRYEGPVKNRRLSKRDAALLIRDIWREKEAYDFKQRGQTKTKNPGEGEPRESMSKYLIQYLSGKFADNNMVYEWSYNLTNACQKYLQDEKIKQFYGILCEELDQEIYFVPLQYIVSLIRMLSKANEGHDPEGVFTQSEFKEHLSSFFDGTQSSEDLDQLMIAANAELQITDGADIEYTRLFFEDDEGEFGQFVGELKKLFENTRLKYIDNVIKILQESGTKPISPVDLEAALYKNDNQLGSTRIEHLVLSTFKVKSRIDLEQAAPVDVEYIQEFLKTRHIKLFWRK